MCFNVFYQGEVDIVQMSKSPELSESPPEQHKPSPQKETKEKDSKKKSKKKNKDKSGNLAETQ